MKSFIVLSACGSIPSLLLHALNTCRLFKTMEYNIVLFEVMPYRIDDAVTKTTLAFFFLSGVEICGFLFCDRNNN